jgi:hypothetical protein
MVKMIAESVNMGALGLLRKADRVFSYVNEAQEFARH